MKRVFLFFAVLTIGYFSFAQTVENIQVEPDGDNIKISYRIGGSSDAQLYNVVLTCSMDGGSRFEPRSVIGDVGNNIRGGRSYYTVIWDVFEDVDEVGSAEFFVRVDLVSDMSVPITSTQIQPVQERVSEPTPTYPDFDAVEIQKQEVEWSAYIAYTGSTQSLIGLSFGSLKNVGAYASFRYGSYITDYETDIWITLVAGLTKYIMESGKYRLHAYVGAGTTVEVYEDIYYNELSDSYLTFDMGLINVIGRLNLTLGLEYVSYTSIQKIYPVFGLGIAF